MDDPNVRLLVALRAKGLSLKSMLASAAEKAEKVERPTYPPMTIADVLNQILTETAKALPDFANILPGPVQKGGGGSDDLALETYHTLLVLTHDVIAVLNSVIPDNQADRSQICARSRQGQEGAG